MNIKAKILRMPEILAETIEIGAKRQGLTQNALILQILWEWVKKNETAT